MSGPLTIFTGTSAAKALAESIARRLDTKLGGAIVGRFPDGEVKVQLLDNVRGRDVFIVQSLSLPIHDNLMELLLMLDVVKRSSASRVTCIIPYMGYFRQDHQVIGMNSLTPIPAKLVARLLQTAGAHRILCLDVHAEQTAGFFNIPVDDLSCLNNVADYIRTLNLEKTVVIGTLFMANKRNIATGGTVVQRAHALSQILECPTAVLEKDADGELLIIGDVTDSDIVIVSNVLDTCKTLLSSLEVLKKAKAKRLIAVGIHPVFSSGASVLDALQSSELEKVVITNTIALPSGKWPKIHVINVAPIIAEVVRRIHNEENF
eukprot:TRINITY_DN3507_c0_g1_i1.p1 TRINITY_DN3507_c0_g1~~TRINITY_DN3507_c0_g1_i1.p1  ORF type:complete len:319 (+),score=63.80 TRINITY_DN3507_c0_g1_i1:86-1042(+)